MTEATKILVTPSREQAPAGSQCACLVHIYPSGPTLGGRYLLATQPLLLGRDENCSICIQEESVSRRHATIQPGPSGWVVVDLQSTNGTFVNDQRVTTLSALKDGDYLRVGNTIYRFLAGGNVEAQYHEEIYRLAIIDALTEVHNKRYLLEFLGRALSSAARYQRPLALIMLDVDRFKSINDRFGHLGGDATLRELATCLKPAIRKEDLLARYGGEEFALVLPETAQPVALEVAERLRSVVAAHPFQYEGQSYAVTISLGVAAAAGTQWLSTAEFIEAADTNLYQAKAQGRNRVVG